MNKKLILVSSVMGGLMLSSALVMAKPASGAGHDFISTLDSNNDGAISSEEFNSNLAGNFSKADKNGDGSIDFSEFSAHGKEKRAAYEEKRNRRKAERREARFAELDGNSDGSISAEEFTAAAVKKAQKRFAKLDGDDQDGKISRQEYSQKQSYGDKKSPRKMSSKHSPHGGKKMFARMDSNGDGKITLEENRLERSKWFKKIDQDQDGLVTSAELKQAYKARKKK